MSAGSAMRLRARILSAPGPKQTGERGEGVAEEFGAVGASRTDASFFRGKTFQIVQYGRRRWK